MILQILIYGVLSYTMAFDAYVQLLMLVKKRKEFSMVAQKMLAYIFAICIFSMGSFCANAASLDDVINYQAPPAVVKVESKPPYTIQDILNKIPDALDDKGVLLPYSDNWIRSEEPGAIAFDKEKFGECADFYIFNGGDSQGRKTINSTLLFLFSSVESEKERGRHNLKFGLERLSDPNSRRYNAEACYNNPQLLTNYKEIINAVIQAAPSVLEEKRRLVAEKQNKAKREQQAKQEAEEKAVLERQANMLAAEKAEEARLAKLTACKNSNAYKLYESSAMIEVNNSNIGWAKNKIMQQEEGAKISGFVDKRVMYEMGNTIAQATRSNTELYGIYKQSGGTAKSVELVRATSPSNPCEK